MNAISLHPAVERHEIHAAVCRPRRQGLACSACHDLAERAARALARQPVRVAA